MTLQKGDRLQTQCYKHDGNVHKCWEETIYLTSTDEYNIFANYKTKVTEFDGRVWRTKEPAIVFFSKTNWFHIIGQIKKDGIYYYCDMASPHVIEDGVIKYIDYDLDLRVFPDGSFKVLDRGEYQYHKRIMNYSNDIDKILKDELTILINKVRNKEYPFNAYVINHYYVMFQDFLKKTIK